MKRLASTLDVWSPYAEFIVRFTAGAFLLPHGAQKLFGWFGGYGVDAEGNFFMTVYNMPPWLATTAGIFEFFGGLLLALGLMTRISALAVAGMLAIVVVHDHWSNGFFWTQNGFEYPLFWCIVVASYAIRGGGAYSLDAKIGR